VATKRTSSPALPRFDPASIAWSLLVLRGHKVLLDSTLSTLYGVPTKALVQAVKRNAERFPADFMFQLENQEVAILRSQTVTSSWGGRRTAPYAFTEQGVAMLSSVLNSPRAIAVSIEIMRAFVHMREVIATNKALVKKLDELERKIGSHDQAIAGILAHIRQIMAPNKIKKRPIGFVTPKEK
jgi:ORF6N domain